MNPLLPPLSSLPALSPSAPNGAAVAQRASSPAVGFGQVLADMAPGGSVVQAQSGDTLIGLVKAHYRQNHQPLSEHQAMRLAHQVAAHNHIDNPDLILVGQKIDFATLQMPALARAEPGPLELSHRNAQWIAAQLRPSVTADALATRPTAWTTSPAAKGVHPVLERTLDRAVAKGFVPAAHVPVVRDKVMALADRYNFQPDDFARLTLMESGGMNPKATNGSCHGIIQFCDGEHRGAASVGMKDNPRAILGMGLLQQLDLVDRYFSQAGLRVNGPPVGLDDLYLTVLTPAAKRETRPDAPLPIAGPQARYLHVGHDTRGPITRNSILDGLHRLTNAMLPGAAHEAALLGQGNNTATGKVTGTGTGTGLVQHKPMARLYGDIGHSLPNLRPTTLR